MAQRVWDDAPVYGCTRPAHGTAAAVCRYCNAAARRLTYTAPARALRTTAPQATDGLQGHAVVRAGMPVYHMDQAEAFSTRTHVLRRVHARCGEHLAAVIREAQEARMALAIAVAVRPDYSRLHKRAAARSHDAVCVVVAEVEVPGEPGADAWEVFDHVHVVVRRGGVVQPSTPVCCACWATWVHVLLWAQVQHGMHTARTQCSGLPADTEACATEPQQHQQSRVEGVGMRGCRCHVQQTRCTSPKELLRAARQGGSDTAVERFGPGPLYRALATSLHPLEAYMGVCVWSGRARAAGRTGS